MTYQPQRKNSFATIWVIWGALLAGELFFMVVESIILSQPAPPGWKPPEAQVANILLLVNAIMLVTIVPVTALVRRTLCNKARVEGLVPFPVYSSGSIIAWAGCESVTFFGLVIALLTRSFWPSILIVMVAVSVQVISYPRRAAVSMPPADLQ